MDPPVIGLDLGTRHLRAAVFRNNRVEVIRDELGNDSTPSYVGFNRQPDNPTILLGQHAYDLAQRDLTLPVYGLKKLLGRMADDPMIAAEKGSWPFQVVAGEDGLATVGIPGRPKLYRPEELLSMLVRKVIENVDVNFGVPVKEAVVTVPACFSFTDRERIVHLCATAGIKVTRMVNEAWAAAVAYGFDSELSGEINVLVINLGAGFFDVGCITIEDTIYEVRASYGSPITPDAITEFHSGNFQNVLKCVKKVKSESKVEKINQIFLSGGSPFLPLLQGALQNLFVEVNPEIVTNPSVAAVRGAAIYAALLGGERSRYLEDLLILSATNFAFGIKTVDGSVKTVVQRNYTYAAKEHRQFTTSMDDQTTVIFDVYETGEQGGTSEERFLGEVVLSDLPPLPKGRLVLDVTFDIDFNHLVRVTVGYAKLKLEKKLTLSKVCIMHVAGRLGYDFRVPHEVL